MKQIGRNIRVLFLLLAGLVIFFHSTIPHHHDLGIHSEVNSTDCNSHQSTGNNETHCHAFNNVVAEKIGSYNFKLLVSRIITLIAVSDFSLILDGNRVGAVARFLYNVTPSKQFFSTELSFRGPPLF